jgi:hypothetical protein
MPGAARERIDQSVLQLRSTPGPDAPTWVSDSGSLRSPASLGVVGASRPIPTLHAAHRFEPTLAPERSAVPKNEPPAHLHFMRLASNVEREPQIGFEARAPMVPDRGGLYPAGGGAKGLRRSPGNDFDSRKTLWARGLSRSDCTRPGLKVQPGSADGSDMFRRLTEPLPLSAASLLVLRPATSVADPDDGDRGGPTSRAAVVVFAEEWGGLGLALGIRSTESDGVIVLRNQESIESKPELARALQSLTAHAERRGFVFADDMLAAGSDPEARIRAEECWSGLMGGVEGLSTGALMAATALDEEAGTSLPPRTPLLDFEPRAGAPDELILEEVVPLELSVPELTLEEIAAPAVEDAQMSEVASPNAIGRVPLVRLRRENDAVRSLTLSMRLLACF